MDNFCPIPDSPALIINAKKRMLVVADLHLGFEYELLKKGINIPNQTQKVKLEIESLIKKTGAEHIVFLGDLKHNIPAISALESKSIPLFLDLPIPFTLIKGNHDGNIDKLSSHQIRPYLRVEDILLMHGHMNIPDIEFNILIVGHSHPAIEFKDELGKRTREKCWARGKLPDGRVFLILPAFNEFITGIPLNTTSRRIPGVLFKRYNIKELSMKAYLLDGTFLGHLEDIAH
ncbi:MAG: metallophosphoesterase [Candidatus Methanofastidiosia archaeon]